MRYRRGLAAMGMLLCVSTHVCRAQWAVIDASNLVQSTLTAFNTGQQVLQQAEQLKHEVDFITNQLNALAYEAANLTKNPLALIHELRFLYNRYAGILGVTQGLTHDLNGIVGGFNSLYPALNGKWGGATQWWSQVQGWSAQVRAAGMTNMQAQAIRDRLAVQQTSISQALTSSDTAAGNLAAIQAGNTLLGIVTEQNTSLQTLLAASERAKESARQAELAEATIAQAQMRDWLRGLVTFPTP